MEYMEIFNMKKPYESPKVEIIDLGDIDIITSSALWGDNNVNIEDFEEE